ncbi:coiled-coil domain-containing protein 27 [Neopelma chrysocephalum]|uniref:coiled-coil domain-containing protein 27 n=1 Tax=Neopelma chrysocephalum TaxID=114329 RepID=UPI000FCD415E|nr:coiled-coil domain-containing protein 27 [Neopelma chrysocephalum]
MDGEAAAGSQESEPTQTLEQLREELRRAKDDHNMATGAISSLQRQLEIQESELRRFRYENEMLQKQLREREEQLQAMSDKFCSLTEEQRKEEAMVMMEEENNSLRQVVAEQESQLAKQEEQISELEGTIRRLRIEVVTSRRHAKEQQQAQEETKSQVEALQHKEVQTKVALERISSKFDRLRSRIIQAAYSVEGQDPPHAELTEEQVMEALQRIADERVEFYHMLKHRDVKVPLYYPGMYSSSPPKRTSSPHTEKLP